MSEASKKGYSIWSLLVIMTFLAVWLAVPRNFSRWTISGMNPTFFSMCCTLCHLALLWLLVGVVVWRLTGKRRYVLYLESTLAILFWLPILLAFVEGMFTDAGDHPMLRTMMSGLGLYQGYIDFYDKLYGWFGYEPI